MGRVIQAAILLVILMGVAPMGVTPVAACAGVGCESGGDGGSGGDPAASPCVTAAAAALSKRGSAYVWGAKGPSTFDCSGLVQWAWKQAGFDVGISTYNQAVAGTRISCTMANLNGSATTCWAPGDLLFLSYSGGQHVALYIADGKFMDCYNSGTGCILHNVNTDPFYQAHFWQARRIVMNCGGSVTAPANGDNPQILEDPGIEQIPDMFQLLYLEVPQCGQCNASGVDPLPATPEPQISFTDPTSPFVWLAWRIGEYVRIILCFLLNFLQLLANLLQSIINAILGALNSFWRLLVYLWIQIKLFVLTIYLLFSDVWGFLHTGLSFDLGDIGAYITMLWDFLIVVFSLLGTILLQILALALIPLNIVNWLVALVITPLLAILAQVTTGTTAPSVLVGGTHPVYQGTRGMLEGLLASGAGWIVYLLIGLAYVGFILWLARVFGAGNLPE